MKNLIFSLLFFVGFVGLPGVSFGQLSKTALNDEIMETRDGANETYNLALLYKTEAENLVLAANCALQGLTDEVILTSNASAENKNIVLSIKRILETYLESCNDYFFDADYYFRQGVNQFNYGAQSYIYFTGASQGWKEPGNDAVDEFTQAWSDWSLSITNYSIAKGLAESVLWGVSGIRTTLGLN